MRFKDKSVVVTGGSGFLGKAVVDKFLNEGAGVRSSRYEMMDKEQVERMVTSGEYIIHLAADCGGIGYNRKFPGQLFYRNMMMSLNIVEACRKAGNVKKLVLLGSVCAYPKFAMVPFSEHDLWKGYPESTNAAYGLAKRETLTLAQAYRKQYGLNSIYLLMVNLYGPHDHFFNDQKSHVIPALIERFVEARDSKAEEVVLWGTGTPTREFLYVEDAAEAIFLATKLYDRPMPVNVGCGHEVSIKELAEEIRSIVGYYGEIKWDSSKPDGQPRRCLDVSKAKEYFNFKAKVGIKEGLRKTVEWYEEEKERRDSAEKG